MAPSLDHKRAGKRKLWTPEEDEALRDYVAKHGIGRSWKTLANNAGIHRCGRSCRARWLNYLSPDLKHGAFTQEEDSAITTLYNKFGSSWSVIASYLPGRTDQHIKNHFRSRLSRRLLHAPKSLVAAAADGTQCSSVPALCCTEAGKADAKVPPADAESGWNQDHLDTKMMKPEFNSNPPVETIKTPDYGDIFDPFVMSPAAYDLSLAFTTAAADYDTEENIWDSWGDSFGVGDYGSN